MAFFSVQNLKVHFPVRSGWLGRSQDVIKAVDDVSFEIERGKTLGLVGESGSGKSTVSRALLKLLRPTSGQAFYQDREIFSLAERDFRPLRKDLQMIFQDPIGSLNPRMKVGEIVEEPLRIHFKALTRSERSETVAALLQKSASPPMPPAVTPTNSVEANVSASASPAPSPCSLNSSSVTNP